MLQRTLLAGLVAGTSTLAIARAVRPHAPREPIVGLPCEGCDAVFDGLPSSIPSRVRLASASEPGEPMLLHGRVRDARGKPRAGIIVYAYQTDREGVYPTITRGVGTEAARHGRLRAWARSDANGDFAFDTVRPGHYPGREMPQHVHLHVIEPGCATYYIDDAMFLDDPVLAAARGGLTLDDRGGSGLLLPERIDGLWHARRDIVLGLGAAGARGCAA